MSFSSEVKEELAQILDPGRHCRIALLAALFHLSPVVTDQGAGFSTETAGAAQAFENTLKREFSSPVTVTKKGRCTTVMLTGEEQVKRFFEALKLDRIEGYSEWEQGKGMPLLEETIRNSAPSSLLLQKTCCRRACLRGMFLAAGSVNDPSRSYHLEIVPGSQEIADTTGKLSRSLGFNARITHRKGRTVIYLKEAEQISDFLGAMGATGSLMKLENARILRDIAGNVNRQVNFETANLKRTTVAALRQREDIIYIENTVGIDSLSPNLRAVARLRIEHPDFSLQELADACGEQVGKSGINHRIQKLCEIAGKIRQERGEASG